MNQIGDNGDAGKCAAAKQSCRYNKTLHNKAQDNAQDCDQREPLNGCARLPCPVMH
ncbi:hypothetical protein GCM10007913_01410 [Devosia yakushimensis]|uniref:Uncharacterized protein n=1 Tax=Devosia yakushimensis TaxID=470028 RepID=A0ABQ5U7U9_9HYPH|nr:hypothetical protein [Devosia yakushimensis]GLQ08209.1 hypothetical protein GCM10007913_01410 [Devosia yakushimensis]